MGCTRKRQRLNEHERRGKLWREWVTHPASQRKGKVAVLSHWKKKKIQFCFSYWLWALSLKVIQEVGMRSRNVHLPRRISRKSDLGWTLTDTGTLWWWFSVWLFVTSWTSLPDSSVHGGSLGKNTGVGCHVLLQRIFLTQGWLNSSI